MKKPVMAWMQKAKNMAAGKDLAQEGAAGQRGVGQTLKAVGQSGSIVKPTKRGFHGLEFTVYSLRFTVEFLNRKLFTINFIIVFVQF